MIEEFFYFNSVRTKSIFIIEVIIPKYNYYPHCFKVGHIFKRWLMDASNVTYKIFSLSSGKMIYKTIKKIEQYLSFSGTLCDRH